MGSIITTPPVSAEPASTPPLEPGDHLSRDEFERRYEMMPGVKKAELIEGIVYMPSPVRMNLHGVPHSRLIGWLLLYETSTPGIRSSDNTSVRLDKKNEVQPDAFMIILPECGGQARISDDDYLEGAPELVAEIAGSSVSFDLHTKLRVYQRNAEGYIESETFPGLRLDPAAMTRLDMATVMGVLQKGLGSPEHAAFVNKLNRSNPSSRHS
jgi:Uma2 family endonuclease